MDEQPSKPKKRRPTDRTLKPAKDLKYNTERARNSKDEAERKCLMCLKKFLSPSKFHRRCPACRGRDEPGLPTGKFIDD